MTKIYGVVGTQRSGSNYVCSALRSIEGLGDPREYFNPVHIHGEDKLIQSRQDALSFAMEVTRNTPKHQYFGFKIHYLQLFENFLEKDVSLLDAFPGMKTIFLRRSNVVKQAISLWKAELTQSWTAEMGAKRKPHYNFGEIRNRYFDLKIHDLMWERYLGDNHIQFLNIIYEDIEKDEPKFFYTILAYLGESNKFNQLKKPSLERQANAQSLEWEARFKGEYRQCPTEQNEAAWKSQIIRWNASELGDDPSIWRGF